MTCRVARSYQHFTRMGPVPCSECGLIYLDVRVASGTLGPYLCPICAQSLSPHVMSFIHASRVPMRHQQVA
jgi:hypothetical protein